VGGGTNAAGHRRPAPMAALPNQVQGNPPPGPTPSPNPNCNLAMSQLIREEGKGRSMPRANLTTP
jgi:hypothetical protein